MIQRVIFRFFSLFFILFVYLKDSRDLTREAMNIPRENVNDFLTKIAHGEVIGSHDSFFSSMASGDSSDSKRRKLSESGSYTGGSGPVSADTGIVKVIDII